MEEKKKLSAIEREKLKMERLQQEMLNSRKRIEEAKNKEALKVWKKIKPLLLKDEILDQIQDPEFVEMIVLDIQQVLEKYIPVTESKQEDKKQLEEEKKEDNINE